MSARSSVGRAKARAVEQAIAATCGQKLVLDRGTYGRFAAHGISRREVHRALDELEARGRVLVFHAGSVVVARLLDGGDE